MSRIETLTPEQIARFAEFRERWTQIGLCTDPADRPRAEEAIREMYRQADLESPKKIVWCGSPRSQALTRAIVLDRTLIQSVGDGVGESVPANLWACVRGSVRDSIKDSIRDNVWESVRAGDRVSGSVKAKVMSNVWASLTRSVGHSVCATVRSKVEAGVEVSVRASVVQSVWRSVQVEDSVGANIWDSVEASVRDSVRGIGDSVRYRVWDSVRWAGAKASIRDSFLDIFEDSVADSVEASVRVIARDSVTNSVEELALAELSTRIRGRARRGAADGVCGAHDAGELAAFRYFHDVLGLTDQTAKLAGLWELAHSAGWALPHRHICWVSERHNILARDDRGRLHSLTGPACAYPDGWAIYAVHGVRVPRYVIEEPREIDIGCIDVETNAEVRRVMIERYRHGEDVSGAAAYVRDSGAERLDHDERFGTLWRRNVPDDEPIVMIEVVNSTRESHGSFKRFWLRVPPNMTTAHEAVAWTFNLPAKDYAPKVET
jgi:hypothetical protein